MPDTKRYVRLKSILLDKITGGDYEPGDRFFSQTELMRTYGLSLATVTRALDELVRDGYLVRQQGKGTFVAKVNPSAVPITESSPRHVNIFALWPGPQEMNLSRIDLAEVYREMQQLLPENISLRLVPLSGEPHELERYLFSRDPMDCAVSFYPSPEHITVLETMAQTVPVVMLHSEQRPLRAPMGIVVTYPGDAVRLAAERLVEYNQPGVAMITNSNNPDYANACLSAFRDTLRRAGLSWRESLVGQTSPTDPTGYHALLDLINRNADLEISGVISAGSGVGLGVHYGIKSMGQAASSRIRLVVCDDPAFSSDACAECSRVIFPAGEIAMRCVAAIKEGLRGESAGVSSVDPIWVGPDSPTTQ